MRTSLANKLRGGLPGPRAHTRGFNTIVLEQLRQVRGSLALAAASMLGYTLTDLLAPWPLKLIFDHVLLDRPLGQALAPLGGLLQANKPLAVLVIALAIIVIATLRGLFAYVQLYQTSRIGYRITYALQQRLFVHLQRLSLTFHHHARSGELLTKLTSDTKALKDVFADSALSLASEALTLLGMFVIMFALNWRLSVIVLLTFPALSYALFYLFRKIKLSARSQRRLEGAIAARISESLASITLVQAFGRERYERERFANASDQTLEESIRTARLEAAATRTVEIISAAGIFAVVLFGSLQALRGTMTPGEVLIFTTYVSNMYRPIRNLAKLSTRFSKAAVSAERIAEILAIEPEAPDRTFAILAVNLRGRIEFRDVSFRYAGGQRALERVSFVIPSGQRVALVGASGAGKSTIANLLVRFYEPSEGCVLIDGVDARDYQRESLRQQIGVVLQDTVLFGATVRDNIAYGKPNATHAEIVHAASLAQAHEFITALPHGYDTVIGERGSTLSGGQRQRISLARAIIKRPPILILDEPTSAVDAESAAQIQSAIGTIQQGKTTLMIAHQFAALDQFDQILVLRDGMIVERGTHADLLARHGYYYELYQLQSA